MTILLAFLALIATMGDAVSTIRFLDHPKPGVREGNPALRWLIDKIGPVAAMLIRVAIGWGAVLYSVLHASSITPIALGLNAAFFGWVTWHNWRMAKVFSARLDDWITG